MRTRHIQYCYRQIVQKAKKKWHLARNPWLCKGTLHTSREYRHAVLLLRVCTPVSLKKFKEALRILKKAMLSYNRYVRLKNAFTCVALLWKIGVAKIYHCVVGNLLPIIFDGCYYCCKCLE